MVARRQDFDADHGAQPAFRTEPQVFASQGRIKIPVILGSGKQVRLGRRQLSTTQMQFAHSVAVGQQAIVADALKA
jgi:hypothetical protein